MTTTNTTYSDLDIAFRAHPISGKLTRKTDSDAVKQSIKSLIMTDYFERPFKSDIGCGIHNYLFENFSPLVKQQIENSVKEVIENYEPRADVLEVLVSERPIDQSITASIIFMVKSNPDPIVLDVLLERIT